MATVLYVMPVDAPAERQERVRRMLAPLLSPKVTLEIVSIPGGPKDLEYHVVDHRAVEWMLATLPRRAGPAPDAVCIGCFYDPGLRELREVLEAPVVGIGQASLLLAAQVAHRFAILVGRRKWVARMMDNAELQGLTRRITAWMEVGVSVQQMRDDPETAHGVIHDVARQALAGGAEAVVLGCAALEGMAVRLQKELGAPVIDPVVAGVKLAELLAVLHERTGLSTSRLGDYEAPTGPPR